ncbi:MAG: 2-hydroxychromene-2-carboxylate isomerase [Deltaproteobacteria bacterium]|nr:MAG: 2-hydroxychromene-2-carboxylate isomerase [Deltaproteobacteria bacterium]
MHPASVRATHRRRRRGPGGGAWRRSPRAAACGRRGRRAPGRAPRDPPRRRPRLRARGRRSCRADRESERSRWRTRLGEGSRGSAPSAERGRRYAAGVPDLEFYFDITCPYAYLASTVIEDVARRCGATLRPRPILLGGIFAARKVPQNLSEVLPPPKAVHNLADMQRQAALLGADVPKVPAGHPRRSVEALRALLVAGAERMDLIRALFRAYWVEGRDLTDRGQIGEVLAACGEDPKAVLARIDDPATKDELRRRTDEALAAGVFGVPTFVVDGELYWGVDRLPMVERALGHPPPEVRAEPEYPVEVYFDYSSPFAYLGLVRAERLFGNRAVYRPMLLGAVFRAVGQVDVPLAVFSDAKRRYAMTDLTRQAAELGVPFRFPSRFPMRTTLPLRVTLRSGCLATAEGRKLAHAIFRAYWAEDRDISDPQVVAGLCDAHGFDGKALVADAGTDGAKRALFDATERAVSRGVFGAPTFIVDTPDGPELFWGSDRATWALQAAAGDARLRTELWPGGTG